MSTFTTLEHLDEPFRDFRQHPTVVGILYGAGFGASGLLVHMLGSAILSAIDDEVLDKLVMRRILFSLATVVTTFGLGEGNRNSEQFKQHNDLLSYVNMFLSIFAGLSPASGEASIYMPQLSGSGIGWVRINANLDGGGNIVGLLKMVLSPVGLTGLHMRAVSPENNIRAPTHSAAKELQPYVRLIHLHTRANHLENDLRALTESAPIKIHLRIQRWTRPMRHPLGISRDEVGVLLCMKIVRRKNDQSSME